MISANILSYDSLGDCSNGGISGRVSTVTVLGPGESDPGRSDAPAVRIVTRRIGGRDYVHAEPLTKPAGHVGPMAGGSFIFTSDSRFSDLTGVRYPISLHDRFETPEQYRQLSI
jgi:hypothetical protein